MFRNLLVVLMMLAPGLTVAGTIDDIARLEQGKGEDTAQVQTPAVTPVTKPAAPTAPVWFHLQDGRSIDVRQWQIVHFVRSDCPYCHRFNPVLKAVAGQAGIKVFVYSFDGAGDAVFPDVAPVNDGILKDFFAELPQATPTDFIVNTQSLVTIPLSQGEMSEEALKQRLDESFTLAVRLGVL
ncbi:thiol-disulfide isomerase [Erwinia typographi]|uniref:Thiol-disulfide isomerase n=1 Tax=Erwinia typographi TaxID=371042 RepID=A0A0A3ZAC9_9GAMM|nr:type-F conjugative transfer system pilin assembly thiol-disulfide isomerase TrbB [Erwinia typographi]KGT94759.1 thiol-disulfide isomerase [Erwinia typographi]